MNIGYNSSQYRDKEIQTVSIHGIRESEHQLPVITSYKLEKDLSNVIIDYCDMSKYPVYKECSRDLWLLERVKKFRIRYFDEI